MLGKEIFMLGKKIFMLGKEILTQAKTVLIQQNSVTNFRARACDRYEVAYTNHCKKTLGLA